MITSLLAYASPTLRTILIRAALHLLGFFYPPINAALKRIRQSPGVPVPNSTLPYWTTPPSPLAQHNADPSIPLPESADIVIIGSGITGTSFARAILGHNSGNDVQGKPLKIIMLEARDTCSGATGRNGGHITPVLYSDYIGLKETYGKEMAKQIIRFRLSHLEELLAVAKEENLLDDSQCRQVEAFDVFHDTGLFRKALSWLREYQTDLPEESLHFKVYESPAELEALQLSKKTVGCISTRAGAVHPYRLVTGILSHLLNSYSSNFELFSHTACTGIKTTDDGSYAVSTPRGAIRAAHVVHATNGWASHLLPGMRGKILPTRGVMTAQMPRTGLGEKPPGSPWTGTRSFVFYPNSSVGEYDYLTQQQQQQGQSTPHYPPPDGELMLGGGLWRAIVSEIGAADDSQYSPKVENYLRQALGSYFSVKEESGEKEKVRGVWSGILGVSADERPWVGRIPEAVTGRQGNGEWIAAGYSGEGMVHAWMSGKILGSMVLGLEDDARLPSVYKIDVERWKKASFEEFVASYVEL